MFEVFYFDLKLKKHSFCTIHCADDATPNDVLNAFRESYPYQDYVFLGLICGDACVVGLMRAIMDLECKDYL